MQIGITGANVPEPHVILQVSDPSGVRIMIFKPDDADHIAKELTTQARNARSGLTVALEMPKGLPNLNGH